MSLIPVEIYPKDDDKLVLVEVSTGPLKGQQLLIKNVNISDEDSTGTIDFDFIGELPITESEAEEMLQPMLEALVNSAIQHAIDAFKEEQDGGQDETE